MVVKQERRCNVRSSRLSSLLVAAIVCVVVAGSALAQTGEVYSLNIVGFQKLTASSQGLTMVSTPFSKAQGTLDEVITNQLYGHKSSTYADNIYLWNPTNQAYENYYLKTDGRWYGFDGTLATNVNLTSQKGFWVYNKRGLSNELFVVSGDVVDDAAVTNSLIVGMNMVSYPFSTPIDLNQSGLTNGFGHKSSTYADNVFLWDSAAKAYQNYYLKTDRKWYKFDGTLATNVMVGGGGGFWYRNKGGSTFVWTEPRPYTL